MLYFSGTFAGGKKHYVYKTEDPGVLTNTILADMETVPGGYRYGSRFSVIGVAGTLKSLLNADPKISKTLENSDIKLVKIYLPKDAKDPPSVHSEGFNTEITSNENRTPVEAGVRGPVGNSGPDGTTFTKSKRFVVPDSSFACVDTSSITIPAVDLSERIAALEEQVFEKGNKKKEIKNMSNKNIFGVDNFDFGRLSSEEVVYSIYGLAVVAENGKALSYHNHTVTDVTSFVIEGVPIMCMPVAQSQVKVGDIVRHNGKYMFVEEVLEKGLKVVDVAAGEDKSILMTKNIFGFNFITKVFNPFGNMMNTEPSAENPFGNPMMLAMLMANEGGNSNDAMLMAMMAMNQNSQDMNPMLMAMMLGDKSEDDDSLMKIMLMSQMMNQQPVNFIPPSDDSEK